MYKYDLHFHSSEVSGCGRITIEEMIKLHLEYGYTGGVITNHFVNGHTCIVPRDIPWEEKMRLYCLPYTKGKPIADSLGFDLLFGVEFAMANGKELLSYGVDLDFLLAHPDIDKLPPEEYIPLVRSAGGFTAQAHPYREAHYISEPGPLPDLGILDGIEVYNLHNKQSEWNDKALALADELGLPYTAGTDAHTADFMDGGMIFPKRIKSGAELANALRDRVGTVFTARKG